MIKVDCQNLGTKLGTASYRRELARIAKFPPPAFETAHTDVEALARETARFKKYRNVLLIANGGSRTSARAFYYGLSDFRNKVNFKFVTSPEARVINDLRKKYSRKDTLVLVISKSGDNINSIEPLLLLLDYPVLVITGRQQSTLRDMAEKLKWPVIEHPEVGGRFSGMTSCGLVPALLMGLEIKKIYAGACSGYRKYSSRIPAEKNDALLLALRFAALGNKGYGEIFASVYSSSLVAMLPLMVQLIHETYGKKGRGQTIFGDYSPESQHHTNQRFFGGPPNIIGLFLSEAQVGPDLKIRVPAPLRKIAFRGHALEKLDGLSASAAMHFDKAGVIANCRKRKIPAAEIMVDKITPESFGEMMVFWQYFAVYSALLRRLDPFDQPEVEAAKKISLVLRINRRKD